MYLRYTTIRKNGKVHKYWWLVRSVRNVSNLRLERNRRFGEVWMAWKL